MNKRVNMKKLILVGAAVGCLLVSGTANAIEFGDGGVALQAVLDGITTAPVAGQSSVDVTTDYVGSDSLWSIHGSGGSSSAIVYNLGAGFASGNTFGIYDATDPSKKVVLFSGGSAGDQTFLGLKADGSVFINNIDTGVDFAANNFGYWLNTPEVVVTTSRGATRLQQPTYTYYSETGLNPDALDHFLAYQGNGVDTIQIPGLAEGTWSESEYIFGWEDLFGGGDKDYEDLVIIAESVGPSVPDYGATLALLGIGMLGLAGLRRRLS
jgi:hypothetical protein